VFNRNNNLVGCQIRDKSRHFSRQKTRFHTTFSFHFLDISVFQTYIEAISKMHIPFDSRAQGGKKTVSNCSVMHILSPTFSGNNCLRTLGAFISCLLKQFAQIWSIFMTLNIIIGIILLAASLGGVVIFTLWSRHIIERIHSAPTGTLKEIQGNINNGRKS
jgi:hypothetical protein